MWAALPHDRGKGGCHQPPGLLGVSSPGTRRDSGSGAWGLGTMGICHSLGSMWQGCAPTCFAFPVCQVGGCRQLSCPYQSTRHRWCMGACDQHQLLLTALLWIDYRATGCRMGPDVCMAALAPLCHPWCLCALFRAWPTACYALLGGCAERDLASWAVLGQGLNWPRSWQGCGRRLLISCTRSSLH